MYWWLWLDREGEHVVDVVERVGEGIHGVSRESMAMSFKVGDLCKLGFL